MNESSRHGGAQRRSVVARCPLGALLVIAGLVLVSVSAFGVVSSRATSATPESSPIVAAVVPSNGPTDALQVSITKAQAQLRDEPRNWSVWADLGSAYVQEARITADPSYYPKAQGALARSLQLQPSGNAGALIGMASLTAARHEFTTSLQWAMRAEAIAPNTAAVYGVLDDALTQLGEYPQARAAVQRMLDLQPSVSSFTRASYDLEEHGDTAGATAALQRALADAFTPADVAFCRYYLGELAFNAGQLAEAARQYQAGLQADPSYFPLIEGVAKVEAAQGQVDAALRDYDDLLQRVPLPQYVEELADYEQSLGRTGDADAQVSLFNTEVRLFLSNGVDVDLESATIDADHGDPVAAVQHARAEWNRRHSVLVADALAWALHRAGGDAEALTYANQALALGWRNALMYFHRGMIEASLGMTQAARADLGTAETINPYFSTLWGAVAQHTLAMLGGAP